MDLKGTDGDDTLTGGAEADFLTGLAGNDVLSGNGGNDGLDGGDGNDSLDAGVGDDWLVGGAGNDLLNAGEGYDYLEGGSGDDTLAGGDGIDTVVFHDAAAGVKVDLTTGVATGAGNDVLSGIENIGGTVFDDEITGDAGSNGLWSDEGNDRIEAGGGDDWIDGGEGNDLLRGGDGSDFVSGDLGDDTLDGGSGLDTVEYYGAMAGVKVDLGAGSASGAAGADVLSGFENVDGSDYGDELTGDGGTNGLWGGAGDDTLDGGAGDDTWLNGGTGNDIVRGGEGADHLEGGDGDDTIDGGSGTDTADYYGAVSAVTVNLLTALATGGAGSDVIAGIENINGSGFDDMLTGDGGANGLWGGFGNDTLDGGAGNDGVTGSFGNDVLRGGDGNDYLEGGENDDTLDGGAGSDTVAYWGATGGVVVDLVTGSVSGGGGNDVLSGIEQVTGSGYDDLVTGDANGNTLQGWGGSDTLRGGGGQDVISGGAGNDSLDGGAILDRINYTDLNVVTYGGAAAAVEVNLASGVAQDGDGGHDTLANFNFVVGSKFNDTLTGSAAAIFEQFDGGPGDDVIDGGVIDRITGSNANRVSYSSAPAAVMVDLGAGLATGGGGNDTLINISHVRGTNFGDNLLGSDTLDYTEGFEGRGGNDTIDGRGGYDMVRFDAASTGVDVNLATGTAADGQGGVDTLANIEAIRGSAFADRLTGGNPANGVGSTGGLEFFIGNAGDDTIDGGGGFDRADYSTSTAGVTVTLAAGGQGTASDGLGGTDTLLGIEGVRGSDYDDRLTGSDAGVFESFEGGVGNDSIDGRGGVDRADYFRSPAAVAVSLAAGTAQDGQGGTDTLIGIEQVRGSWFDDSISGSDADDTLEGGAGADTLDGGAGNDTATFAGNFADYTITIEAGNDDLIVVGPDGTDRLRGIEVLSFADRTFLVQQGSAAADTLAAGDGGELLRGRDGDDQVSGGAGDDAIYGDEGEDSLDGGRGDDFLDGGTGADTMTGGAGNDVYLVDVAGDVVIELELAPASAPKPDAPLSDNLGAGIDKVIASISYTIGSFIENLSLAQGAGNLSGSGNSLANVINGNEGANVLTGHEGDDVIDGGQGVDTASYAGARSSYSLSKSGSGFTVTALGGVDGADSLSGVERLAFADARLALDLDGNAGTVAKILGAVFGPASVGNAGFVGIGLSLADGGMTYAQLADLALNYQLGARAAVPADVVNLLYTNIAGVAPAPDTAAYYVGLLQNGTFTSVSLTMMAADLSYNQDNIRLAGLATEGLPYLQA